MRLFVFLGCSLFAATVQAADPTVVDLGLDSGLQDLWSGNHQRGRANVAADFDLDGRVDFYVGNPRGDSFVVRNVTDTAGVPRFELVQVLRTGGLFWGAAAADYDNDGDYDLFLAQGGNEGLGYDKLFKNMWLENGRTTLEFVDVTVESGVGGPWNDLGRQIDIASANAVWSDYDLDGDVDLFVNAQIDIASWPWLIGRNILWENQGDGTFVDVTVRVGLDATASRTQNSTWFDFDNDGDLDLYECNYGQPNVLWRNRLRETGVAEFENVTASISPPGEDLGYPKWCFATAAADFNNDGWEDLIVFKREDVLEPGSPYPAGGHALFMNQSGTGFLNIATAAGINQNYEGTLGVMGCQIGDLNGDGVPDVFIGYGGPPAGFTNRLFLSDSAVGAAPRYHDATSLIDFPAPESPASSYPPYPYRTHGTAIVDVDEDGQQDLTVANGGHAGDGDEVREPNRLFQFRSSPAPHFFKVRLVGNGTSVSRDAIGTRVALTARRGSGPRRTIYRTVYAGSAFCAQNGFELYFGLGDADTIETLQVDWTDGHRTTLDRDLSIDDSITVLRDPSAGTIGSTLMLTRSSGQIELSWANSCSPDDDDFVIYRGDLSDPSRYSSLTCSTEHRPSATLLSDPGDAFFLVAPRNFQVEGSVGRPADPTATCLPPTVSCTE